VPVQQADVTALDFSAQDLGPGELMMISSVMQFNAGLTMVNLSTNKCFGARDDPGYVRGNNCLHDTDKDQTGWTTFCEAIQSSKSIQTLVLTDIGIGPVGLTTFSKTISDMAGMTDIRLDGNPITGSKYRDGEKAEGVEEYDCDMSGFVALLDATKSSAVSKLSIADCAIGPKGLLASAPAMSDIAGLTDITIDSTGNLKKQKKDTITGLQGGGANSLDLSSLDFGPADLEFLATLLTSFRSFSAGLKEVNLSTNGELSNAPIDALRKSHPNVTFIFTV
jgi:hypothetical protein